MASNIGPLLALRAKTFPLSSADQTQVFLETPDGKIYQTCSFDTDYVQELQRKNSSDSLVFFVAQVIREDAENLYVFKNSQERHLFLLLIELNSVGPKKAALLVGALGVEHLREIYAGESVKKYKIAGIGAKSLEKLQKLMEDASKKFDAFFNAQLNSGPVSSDPSKKRISHGVPDFFKQAMLHFGLKDYEISKLHKLAAEEVADGVELNSQELIQLALKIWAQKKNELRA